MITHTIVGVTQAWIILQVGTLLNNFEYISQLKPASPVTIGGTYFLNLKEVKTLQNHQLEYIFLKQTGLLS